jgi:hypothetical protein
MMFAYDFSPWDYSAVSLTSRAALSAGALVAAVSIAGAVVPVSDFAHANPGPAAFHLGQVGAAGGTAIVQETTVDRQVGLDYRAAGDVVRADSFRFLK